MAILNCGCATFYRSDYYHQTNQAEGYQSTDCEGSLWFGAGNGVRIQSSGKSLFVCSMSQSGTWLTMGPFIPIFPVLGSKGWLEDLRWIKFGLKSGNSWGPGRSDSLEIRIISMKYGDTGHVLFSPTRSISESIRTKIDVNQPRQIKIYSERDFWIGIPGKGTIHIEFEAAGFGRRKVEFSPTSGYSYGFLSG